jgi:hypothetical protein
LELNPANVVTISKQAIARRLIEADSDADTDTLSGE